MQNFGISKEDIRVVVRDNEFGINYVTRGSLSSDIESVSNQYSKSYPITIPANYSGTHQFSVIVEFGPAFSMEEDRPARLSVSCDEPVVQKPTVQQPVVQQPVTQETTTQETTTQANTTPVQQTSESTEQATTQIPIVPKKDDKRDWILFILFGNLILLLIGTIVLLLVYSKPKKPAPRKDGLGELQFAKLDSKLQSMSAQDLIDEADKKPDTSKDEPKDPKKFSYY